ncbi:hypothetical protein BCHO_0364 [Bifidobacterium choerinum]|uniref:DUF2252 domain-containing protein n=3 Tax=Bifidobacterium choerinum TaxID=35760 RepID=A0A087AHN0_9BIFI|nr:hypothetical protein BCHO_0364 [Bifidobacterium choerinum]
MADGRADGREADVRRGHRGRLTPPPPTRRMVAARPAARLRAIVAGMTHMNGNIVVSSPDDPVVDITTWRQSPTPRSRARAGIEARQKAPLDAHAVWKVVKGRRDVIGLLEEQSKTRLRSLIPLRYHRMSDSAFTFYRGTALIMANDLARTPVTGIPVQAVGDAHIGNFGIFYSPTMHLVFDINDFDETTTGPWEWDIKRLAVSIEICGRANDIYSKDRHKAVRDCVKTYRDYIDQFSKMRYLDMWYDHLDIENTLDQFESSAHGKRNRTLRAAVMKAKSKDSASATAKLTYLDGDRLRFRSMPPELVPINELEGYDDIDALQQRLDQLFASYHDSLYEDRRHVLSQYHYQDTARKVVGVGSVGTRAWVSVLTGRDIDDPLMLQMKEATDSVLERFVGRSRYPSHGERVVQGQKLIQTTADIMLGWTKFVANDGNPRDYYVRQLWNGKGSIDINHLNAVSLNDLGRMCAWCLAHAHARSGDSIAIANYLGGTDAFDVAMTSFADSYADQNEEDYRVFKQMIKDGELPCAKD